MSSEKRPYALKARAAGREATRQRIIEVTASLHEEVGPARTTVADIARRAGVSRLTVYNHFPGEMELFAACGDHWLTRNPPPDPSAAFEIDGAGPRLRAVLRDLYSWYRTNARACENIQRDRLVMPALDAVTRIRMDKQFSDLAGALASAFGPTDDTAAVLRAAVAVGLDFWTWRRLASEGLSDDAAAGLMACAAEAACSGVQQKPVT